jgi:hypothetical protein
MGKKLRDRGFRDLRMQVLHILADRVIQPQLASLAQLHDSGRGKTLGMRCDPKAVARGQLFAGDEVGRPEGVFGNDLAAMRDRDDAAGLLRGPQLKFDPAADVVCRELQPRLHVLTKIAIGCLENSTRMFSGMLPDKTKPAQPSGLCRSV